MNFFELIFGGSYHLIPPAAQKPTLSTKKKGETAMNETRPHPRIVGIFGYATSGKDAVVPNSPIKISGVDCYCHRRSASTPIIADIQQIIGSDHDLSKPAVKAQFRDMLVHYAEDWRKIDPLHWIKYYQAEIDYARSSQCIVFDDTDIMVFTGLRDPNEARWIHDQGGLLIYLRRPGVQPANSAEYLAIQKIQAIYPYKILDNTADLQDAKHAFCNLVHDHFTQGAPLKSPIACSGQIHPIGEPKYCSVHDCLQPAMKDGLCEIHQEDQEGGK